MLLLQVRYDKKTDSFNIEVFRKLYYEDGYGFDYYHFLEELIGKYFKRHKILNRLFTIYPVNWLIKKVEKDLHNYISNRIDILIKTKILFMSLGEFNHYYEKLYCR